MNLPPPIPGNAQKCAQADNNPRFIIGVRVQGEDRTEFFDPGNLHLPVGTLALVKTRQGEKIGSIASNKIVNFRKDLPKPLPKVLRVAGPRDIEERNRVEELESKSLALCMEKIAKLKLPMNLSRAVYFPDTRKTVFYFTAEGRVDFRELVRELAQNLKTKIEMRQVGVRDEARAITGYGVCGESLCCSTFLKEFTPVTIRMAKDQGLALNPSKISGVCGRLMCCLQYEHDGYKELVKGLPKINARVETPEGPGKVVKIDILTQKVTARLDDESIATYDAGQVSKIQADPRRERQKPKPS
ncbi:MAG: stage 0 sporulation family protein [Nitrospinae bacterium]|nr:stage 0 sporulation family protein [Nitrospinota bacterium]